MSDQVITSLDQVSAEWLTHVLKASGALKAGAVEAFAMVENQTRLSENGRLDVQYTPDAEGDRPQNLFLKLVNTDLDDEFFGDSELHYYFRDYLDLKDAPLVGAYDGAYSEVQRRYHLLMDDLSATHTVSIEKPPTLEYGLALAEALAALHAHWWGRERLEASYAPLPSAAQIERYVGIARPGAGHIIAACANQLEPHWPEAILDLYANHPRLMIERTRDGNGFTLIHGDLNAFNILVPLEGHRPIYLIDRQPFDWSLTTWLGAFDVAYPLLIDWEVDMRRQIEIPLLKRYHEHLIMRGVRGYSWEQLWHDYRLSAAICVYVVTEWCRGNFNAETMPIWMPMLQKTMTAFDDLEIALLWQRA